MRNLQPIVIENILHSDILGITRNPQHNTQSMLNTFNIQRIYRSRSHFPPNIRIINHHAIPIVSNDFSINDNFTIRMIKLFQFQERMGIERLQVAMETFQTQLVIHESLDT